MDPVKITETQPSPETRKPSHSVRVLLFDKAFPSKFLILTDKDDEDNWRLPGGRLATFDGQEESARDAAEREVAEEVGLTIADAALEHAATLQKDDSISARYIYFAHVDSEKIKMNDESIARIAWVSEDALPPTKNLNLILAALAAVKDAQKGEPNVIESLFS